LAFGLSWLTSLQFIQYYVAGFYKPTIPQSPPSHLRDYSTCNNARLEFSTIFVPSFDPNEWCLKNGLHSGGLNSGPLGHESSALTTRPRLLASTIISLILVVLLVLLVFFLVLVISIFPIEFFFLVVNWKQALVIKLPCEFHNNFSVRKYAQPQMLPCFTLHFYICAQ
jgi:hypothetical protein